MNEIKPSYFGKCYACGKMKEIVTCISWGTQTGSDGKKVFGGYRNLCADCEKKYNIGINRLILVKRLSDVKEKVNLSKYSKCSKCKMYYYKTNDFGDTCLICWGRSKWSKK